LWQLLVQTWAEFQQSMMDDAIDQWQKRLEACFHTEGGHFELSYGTTGCFQSYQHLEETIYLQSDEQVLHCT